VTTTGLSGFGKLESIIDQFLDDFSKIVRRNEQFRGLNIDF